MRRRLKAAKQQFVDDISADPYLAYILGFAFLLGVFGIWHRLPNFATRDERWRVIDPMEVIGHVLADPSVDSVRRGLLSWRNYGATFYLYGLAILPVIAVAVFTGQMDVFVDAASHRFAAPSGRGTVTYYQHWQQTPDWVWSWSIGLARFVNVIFGVASVYLMYRIGTTLRDRATGRLMALLLTVTWSLQILVHEAGEDGPGVFFLLAAFYLSIRYVESGERWHFYVAAFAGGFATAVKLSMGVAAIFLGLAYLIRARHTEGDWTDALLRGDVFVGGLLIGAVTIFVGYPSAVAGGIDVLIDRFGRGASAKSNPHNWRDKPSWWWLVRSYLNSVGIPMALAFVGGVLASIPRLRERSLETEGVILSLVGLGIWLAVFARWAYIRSTHLFPTVPILIVLLALALMRLDDSKPSVARPVMAVLLITSGLYATVGVAGYANQPHDQATRWLATNAPENATVETYAYDQQEAAVPHGMNVNQPTNRTMVVDNKTVNPGWGKWVLSMPERCPEYIQLNYPAGLYYLAPDDHSMRAQWKSSELLTNYYRNLLEEDKYAYRVAATFGPQPWFLKSPNPEPRGTYWNLIRPGIYPRTIQYGDPQDFGVDQYVVILERTGECDTENNSPFY